VLFFIVNAEGKLTEASCAIPPEFIEAFILKPARPCGRESSIITEDPVLPGPDIVRF
jgi:hypothetical protein